jgi:hypothetical protein
MPEHKHQSQKLFVSGVILVLLGWGGSAVAATAKSAAKPAGAASSSQGSSSDAISNTVTQSYNANSAVQPGMLVQLDPKDSKTVDPLAGNQVRGMLGVVVPDSDAAIVLSPQTATEQQVLVATSGRQQVLVSNQNGPIKVGDYVTISAVAGIAMEATDNQTQVLGKAASSFSGSSNVVGTIKLQDSLGADQSVAIGRIAVDINISHNPLFQKSVDYVPGFLAKISATVASKPVSAARIYISCGLLLMTAVITGNMLYSGVRNGMKAVGRNPLSKKSIIRSLIQTVIAGLIIFVAGVFAVYLLLKL